MDRTKLWTLIGLTFGGIVIFFGFMEMAPQRKKGDLAYTITERWELPYELMEISGIAWLEDGKMAAVQDEDGILYMYDLKDKKIGEEIEFAGAGDYEGLAVHNGDAYVLRSDGTLFEITNFRNADRAVKIHKTPFKDSNNMESLEWDAKGNRLLIAPKDYDLNTDRIKGIYAFSLDTKTMLPDPIFSIDMGDRALKRFRNNSLYKTFRPSDLAVHPKTGELFVLDGSKPKLLIMDADGNINNAYSLDKKVFPQPEGITFGPDGTLYISSEGKKGAKGTITQLELNR
jgi:uncharacterized protein YjiK